MIYISQLLFECMIATGVFADVKKLKPNLFRGTLRGVTSHASKNNIKDGEYIMAVSYSRMPEMHEILMFNTAAKRCKPEQILRLL
jgi:hypothetical protein